eukprot:CAMPEP_0172325690 /NCGR_PEP_ID=MMETSP1058-20130122/54540_1 /TAXON_ID=83371 /ORGANISM="Detonula confervacea, Strain CCMP 353" /LENGTH=51 /DNA_ID=CAMNT_0013042287 /DNA_START=182 /DNA_END=334 /DNA_ORIENTATION=-
MKIPRVMLMWHRPQALMTARGGDELATSNDDALSTNVMRDDDTCPMMLDYP